MKPTRFRKKATVKAAGFRGQLRFVIQKTPRLFELYIYINIPYNGSMGLVYLPT